MMNVNANGLWSLLKTAVGFLTPFAAFAPGDQLHASVQRAFTLPRAQHEAWKSRLPSLALQTRADELRTEIADKLEEYVLLMASNGVIQPDEDDDLAKSASKPASKPSK